MMKRRSVLLSILFLVFVSFLSCSQIPRTEAELTSYLDDLGEKYEAVCVEMGTQNWNLYSKEADADQDAPKKRYSELLMDPTHLNVVKTWLEKIDASEKPRLYRRLFVWRNILTAAKIEMDEEVYELENQLELEINEYSHDFNGERVLHNDLRRVLEQEISNPDKREEVYNAYAGAMQKEFEPRVLGLMKLRNQKAREAGFTDYGEMSLFMTELLKEDSLWFYDSLDFIEERTRGPLKDLISAGEIKTGKDATLENLEEIVHAAAGVLSEYAGYAQEEALGLAKQTLAPIGFDIDNLPVRVVEQAIPYGGLNLAVHIPSDVRILVKPETGRADLFLHEFGHGLEAVFNKTPEPEFKNYEWCLGASCPSFEEGMANVLEKFAYLDKWQMMFNKKSKARVEKEKESQNLLSPYTIRSTIADFLYEFELYRNLDTDPEKTARDLYKKWLLVDGESPPQALWATSIFPVAYPCYRQSYFIADIIAWQVHAFLRAEFGEDYMTDENTGEWLVKNLFEDGYSLSWMEHIERATGKKLDIVGFLAGFSID